jgi:arginyl-tRNA--protein-N-Asp/Glu arginylyltransferase
MANEARNIALKQEYDYINEEFKTIRRLLDQYEQSGQRSKGSLKFYQTLVDDNWKQFNIVFDKLLDIDDNKPEDLFDVYSDLTVRLMILNNIDSSSTDVARTIALEQEYDYISEEFKTIWRLLDQYAQSGQRSKGSLKFYQTLVDDNWKRFNIVFDKLLDIDDNEPEDLISIQT